MPGAQRQRAGSAQLELRTYVALYDDGAGVAGWSVGSYDYLTGRIAEGWT